MPGAFAIDFPRRSFKSLGVLESSLGGTLISPLSNDLFLSQRVGVGPTVHEPLETRKIAQPLDCLGDYLPSSSGHVLGP